MSIRRCVTIVNLTPNKLGRFWRIARRLPDVEFLAVRGGYGPQRVPRRLPRNVTVLDHVPAELMDELVWRRTAILLAPSLVESWGMAASEALLRGIPVIAHPAAGLVESLSVAGIFIHRDHHREWARVIDRLLADPRRYARRSALSSARARQLVEQSSVQLAAFVDDIERIAHV